MTAAVLRAERGGFNSEMARSQVKHTTKVLGALLRLLE